MEKVIHQIALREEVKNFSEDQAKALFVSAANLESGTAKVSKMDFSSEIPDFVPAHPEMKSNSNDIGVLSNSDKSTRTSYETGSGVNFNRLS